VQPVTAYEEFASARDDVLIYHHSVGWPAGPRLFERSRNRKALRYHSVTPSRFFRPYDAEYTEFCRRGEMQTRALLCQRPEIFMATSDFTAWELERAGSDRRACRIVPPFHAIADLEPLEEDAALAARLCRQVNIVFVGRVVPNKGHLHLIRAFGHFRRHFQANARLYLIGRIENRFATFLAKLQAEIDRHLLSETVHFTGPVSPNQLKTFYACASLFLCTSEHEGFCVPLVEAMYYGVPIVAFGSTAIPGTLGDDGLVWDTPNPALLAESMAQVLTRLGIRQSLVRVQRRRFDSRFTLEAIARAFAQAIEPLLVAGCKR